MLKGIYNKKQILFFSTLVVILFSIGFLSGRGVSKDFGDRNKPCLSNLEFINPNPGCELFEQKLSQMSALQKRLDLEIEAYLSSGRAERISAFARDLSSLRYVGVNDADTFFMASLLKVPLAIAYFRLSEITPDILDQKVKYSRGSDDYSIQSIVSPEKLVNGNEYTIRDLIFRSLAYSDNAAAEILSENFVSFDYLQKILQALGLQLRSGNITENLVTARSYASVFRTLYNSSFLNRELSNEMLDILSKSIFSDGARKNIPKDVVVAHKFGERSLVDEQTGRTVTKQLHDCGIVYAKDGMEPYTFCIMTEGQDFDDLRSIIAKISLTIYEEITK
ncbi:MAG: b-lactamase [Parcubacteria bacterium C7867-005]|nr:MAG: b-lactamase [Parcubacteria bacterium C7867-005]